MKADAQAMLFSAKCLVAAMLAYYVALRIGLTRPYWAVTTSYIVAQPLAGAVLSKAVFRFLGTFLGAAAAVVLVPAFVNEPIVLSLALALWLGLCLYISLLDRTPRAYVFLLAGYTASIVGFPSVGAPGAIFTVAILRVQEIVIGILAGSFVHGVLFPVTVTGRLFARIDAILADAERWTRAALAGAREATLDRERRRLALDLADLHQLSIHLPFDTARILPRVRTLRALEDQLSLILPLATTIEDRLAELAACNGGVSAPIAALVTRFGEWLAGAAADPDRDASAQALIDDAAALEPIVAAGGIFWPDMLRLNLLSRLAELIATHRDARALRDQMRSPSPRAISPHVAGLLAGAGGRALHRDRGLALRAAFGTIVTIVLGCTFWIGTAWPDGAGAVLIAGVCCALFGNVDDPGPVIFTFLIGSAIGLGVALFYAYTIMPRVTDYVSLAGVVAPPLLVIGSMLARPHLTLLALGTLLGFANTVGFTATYSGDFAGFLNGAISQLIGTGFAAITVGLFQTIGVETSVARLVRAGWGDGARRAAGQAPNRPLWVGRMLDRVGLLLPRLAARAPDPGQPLLDALRDLRTGVVAGDLAAFRGSTTPEERSLLDGTLAGVGAHFRALRPSDPALPATALLAEIDRSVAAFVADPEPARRREGLILLTSLRRNLFPSAPAYAGAPA